VLADTHEQPRRQDLGL